MTGATRRSEGPVDARPVAHARRRLDDEDGQLTILLVGLIVLVLMVLALGWTRRTG
jgi:hypothetical protein